MSRCLRHIKDLLTYQLNNIQQNGNREMYNNAFGHASWNDALFLPKYDLKPTSCNNMFSNSKITDLKALLSKAGVVFDTSMSNDFRNMFYNSTVTHIGIIDARKAPSNWLGALFNKCARLITVDELCMSDLSTSHGGMFTGCSSLKEITITGVIGCDISFIDSSELNVTSAKSALIALKNYTGTDKEFYYSILFHSNVWDLLDVEGKTAPGGVTWRNYMSNKGWLG